MTTPIRVLHADDQRVVREGLGMLLGLLPGVEVIGAASGGEEAVALAIRLRPDVVLMDLRMPGCDGVEATRRLSERAPEIKVIVLTTYVDDRSVADALQAGARGYLTKDCGAAEIRHALEQVVNGQVMIDPAVEHHLVDATAAGRGPSASRRADDSLTVQESEILSLVAEGLSNIDIATELVISEATVRIHVGHILTKIGVNRRAQAVTYAYRHGLAIGVTRRADE
jgi:DNA-binding NarL/FixJ family response regulator